MGTAIIGSVLVRALFGRTMEDLNQAEDDPTIVDLSWIRGTGKILFRPQLFYQEVLSTQMGERSLFFRIGLGDDCKNCARLGVGEQVPADSSYAKSCAKCVDPLDSPGTHCALDSPGTHCAKKWSTVQRNGLLCERERFSSLCCHNMQPGRPSTCPDLMAGPEDAELVSNALRQ